MYNILEQAIVDAKALREAALKNAETAVLERYSDEVKSAIDVMLEAEMEPVEEATIIVTPEEEAAEPVLAAAEGEDLCGCPDAEEEVEWELSLDDLKTMSDAMPEGEPMEQDALAAEFGAEPEEEDEFSLQETAKPDFLDLDKDGDKKEPMKDAAEESLDEEIDLVFEDEEKESDEPKWTYPDPAKLAKKTKEDDEPKGLRGTGTRMSGTKIGGVTAEGIDEDIELDEDMIEEIAEAILVDIKPAKGGWAGTPESVVRHQEEQELARLAGTEAKEHNDALVAANQELSEALKASETEGEKLKQLIYDLKGRLDESILSSAKLLYTNQTLTSASLNERQKNRIVESIQDADSVEEAKVIYETLQNAAGPSTRKNPKSLSEAISRPSLNVPRRRRENSRGESVVKNRFQKLAGIKNK